MSGNAQITKSDLLDLSVGDMLSSGVLLPGIDATTMDWVITHISSKGVVSFNVFYMGIKMLSAQVAFDDEKPVWRITK